MNAKVIKGLKLKAKRYTEEINKDKAITYEELAFQEKKAYQELKKMYKESSIKERKELGL